MKIGTGFFVSFLILLCGFISMKAQDVNIIVPAADIFNRTEFITVQRVMNTQGHKWWEWDYLPRGAVYPTVRALTSSTFSQLAKPGITLPASILQWRLATIGGKSPPFKSGDIWPGFKSFGLSSLTWFEPIVWNEQYPPGDINFTFKISAENFKNNLIRDGIYAMNISQNYGTPVPYGNGVTFSPPTFYTYITIPKSISWLNANNTSYTEIKSLDAFKTGSAEMVIGLGNLELASTVDFNVWAKASATNIQFVSSKGVNGTRNISSIQLGSSGSELTKKALSSISQNFSSSVFGVKVGNRNNFIPQLSVSASDFKTHFFEAGTYTFQLNLDAKSTDNSISKLQNTDVTIKVPALSEINIPSLGKTVTFNFNTAADYSQGQTKVMPNQIKLSNNENFELYVKSDENYFKKGGVQTDVQSSILQIGAVGSNTNAALSTKPKKIFASSRPVLDHELSMNYTISSTSAQSLVGKEKATYSINVIYSFTAL